MSKNNKPQTVTGDQPQPAPTIESALASMRPQLEQLNSSIGAAQTALCDAYKALVALVEQHRAALCDEVGKLQRGVLDSVVKLAPHVDRSTFSSAWSAFCRNPQAFSACAAIRQFRNVEAPGAQPQPDSSPDVAKLVKQFAAACERAVKAGASPVLLIETLKTCVKSSTPAQPQPASAEPQPAATVAA